MSSVQAPVDFGGAVGVVEPIPNPIPGPVLAITLLDPCGEALTSTQYAECDCTYSDPAGSVRAWDATFLPSGDLALGLSVNGYYRFSDAPLGGSGTTPVDFGDTSQTRGLIIVLEGPAAPASPPTCAAPNLPTPVLQLSINGAGSVNAGAQTCTGDCEVEGELFSAIELNPVPDPGYRFAGWSGACEGRSPCTVPLDDTTQSVEARFEPTHITGVWSLTGGPGVALVEPLVAAASNGDTLLAVRVQDGLEVNGQTVLTDTVGLPGVVVAIEPNGDVRFSTRLDPVGQGGTSATGLFGEDDEGVLLTTSTGRLVSLAPDGAVRLDVNPPELGNLSGLAVAGDGTIGLASSDPVFAGVDASGLVQWTVNTTGAVTLKGWVAQPDGFAALILWTGAATVGDTSLPATGGRALLDISSAGALRSATVLDAAAPDGVYQQFYGVLQSAPDGLYLIGDTTRDPTAPSGQAYAEPIDALGALRGATVSSPLLRDSLLPTSPLLPLTDTWMAMASLPFGVVQPGVPEESQGETDLLLGLLDSTGLLELEPAGGTGADFWLTAASRGNAVVALGRLSDPGVVGEGTVPAGYVLMRIER